jgi:membrane protease YdiL (CAAX protease family)
MSDITLTYRSAELLAPEKTTAEPAPLGLLATLGWGAAAYGALWSPVLIDAMLSAVWGPGVGLPAVISPIGHIAAGAVVMAAVWHHRRSLREYLAMSPLGWGDVARGLGYGILGFIGLGMMFMLITIVQMAFGVEPATGPTLAKVPFNMQTMIGLASLWFGMVVAAPIVEEMLFRGLMYRGLAESRIGVIGAMLITSVVFGLAHYPGVGWTRVIATGVAGLFFAWLRWYYGNTSVGMVAHAVTNTIGASIMTAVILLP